MRSIELVSLLRDLAENKKTLYVSGGYGRPLNEENKEFYLNNYAYNRGAARKKKILAADGETYAFDCICLIKAIRCGWNGDRNDPAAGVTYRAAWDLTEKEILDSCSSVSKDFSSAEAILPGEYLWMSGHGGIYLGGGQAVECTPSWKDGVQITSLTDVPGHPDGNGRRWTAHGRLPWVEYDRAYLPAQAPVLTRGCTGKDVARLQRLLTDLGYPLETDGSFGPGTERLLRSFQSDRRLVPDASCGPATWTAILNA